MSLTTRNFDIVTAFLGQTLRHVASQQCFTVVRVMPATGRFDTAVGIKDVHGRFTFLGSEYDVQADDFVELLNR